MKKVLFTLLTLLAFNWSNAQKTQKPQFGIKGGMNVSNLTISGEASPEMKSKIEYNIGGLIQIKIGEKLFLQPEVIFSKQGSEFKFPITIDGVIYNTENTFNLYYINVPIILKYYATNEFSLEFGPHASLLSSSNLVVRVLNQSNTQDAQKLFKSSDFGLNLGANFDINKNFFINARYSFGLSNIAVVESGDNTIIKNNVFSINLCVKFN